jgi:hypothetical protein
MRWCPLKAKCLPRRHHGPNGSASPQLAPAPHSFAHRPAGKGTVRMANILVNIEKGIEIGAEDALKWLTGANKTLKAAPQVIAALATLIGAVEKPITELAGAASNPLNIALDIQTAEDLKAVWPDVKTFLSSLGVKF